MRRLDQHAGACPCGWTAPVLHLVAHRPPYLAELEFRIGHNDPVVRMLIACHLLAAAALAAGGRRARAQQQLCRPGREQLATGAGRFVQQQ
jgi:hypothetical protein